MNSAIDGASLTVTADPFNPRVNFKMHSFYTISFFCFLFNICKITYICGERSNNIVVKKIPDLFSVCQTEKKIPALMPPSLSDTASLTAATPGSRQVTTQVCPGKRQSSMAVAVSLGCYTDFSVFSGNFFYLPEVVEKIVNIDYSFCASHIFILPLLLLPGKLAFLTVMIKFMIWTLFSTKEKAG
jgi:hypothetical protein